MPMESSMSVLRSSLAMKNGSFLLVVVSLVFSCAPLAGGTSLPSGPCSEPRAGCTAPGFTLSTPSGESYSLSSHSDKIVILNFWASWCGPCKEEMPDLEKLHQTYFPHGVLIFGVNDEDSPVEMADFGKAYGLSFPLLVDTSSTVSRDYQIQAYPTTFFIDSSGEIFNVQVGSMTYAQFEDILLSVASIAPKPPVDSPEAAPTSTASLQAPVRGCVTAGALNVRPLPSKEAAAIDWFYEDECYWFKGRTSDNQWLCLDGQLGWVSAKWIHLEGDIESLPVVEK